MFFSRKRLVVITVILAATFAISACSNSPETAQKKIDQMARDMQEDLPKMLDSDTRLMKVYTGKLELVSEYRLVNYKATADTGSALRNKIDLYLKTQVCPGIKKELLQSGISSRYIYEDSEGRVIGNWLIAPGDC